LLCGQAPQTSDNSACRVYYAIEPLDQSVLKLLVSPAIPPGQAVFMSAGLRQLRDWDFPPKVTPWRERPSPEEVAKQRDEVSKAKSSGLTAASQGSPEAHELQPWSAKDWDDLEKWFGKEAPKRIPGLCVDPHKAGYVLAIGVIAEGSSGSSLTRASAHNEYNRSATSHQADASVGPNAATSSTLPHENNPTEFSGMNTAGDPSGSYTCTYLYRTTGAGQSPARRDTPDFYYCRSGGSMPRSVVTTLLKYLAKTDSP
jgi:hypothetical protein